MKQIQFIDIVKDRRYHRNTINLYRNAFPIAERIPVFIMKSRAKRGKAGFYSLMENDKFVGLAYQVFYKDIVYIFFFAIEESLRGQGYGSNVLSCIKEQYPDKRIILMAEAPDEKSRNNEERIKRIRFYNSNGFNEIGYNVMEVGVIYTMLCYNSNGKEVSKPEFRELMREFWGDFLFEHMYKKISG